MSMDNRNIYLSSSLVPSSHFLLHYFPHCRLQDCKQFDRLKDAIVVEQREIRALLADSANKIDEFADILALKCRRQSCENDRLRERDRGRSDF